MMSTMMIVEQLHVCNENLSLRERESKQIFLPSLPPARRAIMVRIRPPECRKTCLRTSILQKLSGGGGGGGACSVIPLAGEFYAAAASETPFLKSWIHHCTIQSALN